MKRGAPRTACFYALLVLAVWGPFTLASGMPFETGFPFESETAGVLGGFFFYDRLRVYTNLFYHVAYLLGEAAGVGGSFVPYQIVHALLWWGRGLVCFLILRRLHPELQPFHAAVGGLVILHGSDGAVNWVGQLNQHGMIVWTLLSFYGLVRALQAERPRARWTWSLAAACFAHLSLWSYESQLVLMCLVPPLLAAHSRGRGGRRLAVFAPYLLVVLTYLALSVSRYVLIPLDTYQLRQLRGDWSVLALGDDLAFNLAGSLEFWRWGALLPEHAGAASIALLAGLAAASLALMLALDLGAWRRAPDGLPGPRLAGRLLAAGGVWVVASFPAYLLLEDARSMWRTQLLSGPGCALLLAAGAALLARVLPEGRPRAIGFLLLGSLVAWFGANAALRAGAWHRHLWERHREVMARLLELVPDVRSPALFAVTGIPPDADPFGDHYWLDHALRLAYPGRQVSGLYFRADGTPGPGAHPLSGIAVTTVIGIGYERGGLHLLSELPEVVPIPPDQESQYLPARVIRSGPAPPRALRRYGVPASP